MEKELSNSEKLLNALIPFAQQQLDKQGDFAPFAGMFTKDDEIHFGMAAPEKLETEGGVALSQESIDRIILGHIAEKEKNNLLISGICFDTRVSNEGKEKEDAICISLEEEGKSINVFLPYKKSFFGKIKYGQIFASAKEPKIFIKKSL